MTEELPQRDRRFLTEKKIKQRKKLRNEFTDNELEDGKERDHFSFVCPRKGCSCKRNKWRDATKRRRQSWKKDLDILE